MRILLIAPASGGWHGIGRSRFFNGKTFRFSLLSLLAIAAESPEGSEIVLVDEQVERIPWGERFDLAAITCMTAAAPRAYEIAAGLRARGVPVVLGGMHPTFMPEEALANADAVCVGEGEAVWPRIVEDARRGRLGGVYREEEPRDLAGLKRPPRHLLRKRRYTTIQSVQATRGCPHRCAFCSVSAFHGGRLRCRPVGEVVAEVASFRERFFMFVDDSLTSDRDYARELFAALRPLGRRWVGQATLAVTDDRDLVRLAARAGCIGFFVGLESLSDTDLACAGKGFNKSAEYAERIARLHEEGITVEAGMAFGFDGEGPGVFRESLAALDRLEVDMIQPSILTPLPGTPLAGQVADRIFDRDWSRYDFHHAVFTPARMSVEDLQAGHDWIAREFYRPSRIARRLARMARRRSALPNLPGAALLNAAYYGRAVKWGWRGHDPAQEPA